MICHLKTGSINSNNYAFFNGEITYIYTNTHIYAYYFIKNIIIQIN